MCVIKNLWQEHQILRAKILYSDQKVITTNDWAPVGKGIE